MDTAAIRAKRSELPASDSDSSLRERVQFAVMALIWGTTWIAIKAGVTAVPPLLFAGTRFVAAGLLLLAGQALWGGLRPVPREDWPRLAAVALLVITATYALLFWGMQNVPSGLAGVINLALMPVALLGLGVAHGEERFRMSFVLAVAVGLVGLLVLFAPSLQVSSSPLLRWGLGAIVLATLAYAWGSVLNRRLLRRYGTVQLSGVQTLLGGVVLCAMAGVHGDFAPEVWRAFLSLPVLAGWLYLVLGGSLVAFTLYMHLVHAWSAARAGLYAFVSPVVALAAGALVYGEPLTRGNVLGSALVLAGAWLALRRD